MGKKDPRVDAYIAASADFAQPILKHLRKVIHQGCSDLVETIKWGMPFFEYKGPLCGMAAFKQHAAFFFWRDVKDVIVEPKDEGVMGQLGRIRTRADLPSEDLLRGYVSQAVALRDAPKALREPVTRPKVKPVPPVPAALKTALAKNPRASSAFAAFSPSHRREYIEWIMGAKREETRDRRIATAIEWIAEGKNHNWRYEKKT